MPTKSTRISSESTHAAPQQGESAPHALQTTGVMLDALEKHTSLMRQIDEISRATEAATMLGAMRESARDCGAVSGAMLAT